MNLDTPTRARLPAALLANLGDLRNRSDLEILLAGPHLWLRWRLDIEAIVLRLLPLPDVQLFESRGGRWFPAGRLLPSDEVPDDRRPGWRHISSVLFPARMEPQREALAEWESARLKLAPSDLPRPTRALRADFEVVLSWCETALTGDITRLRAAWTFSEVLLFGDRLPSLVHARRYHGGRILLPLGFTVAPELPEEALTQILGLVPGEIALLDETSVEILEEARITPLTRAALRRAAVLRQET